MWLSPITTAPSIEQWISLADAKTFLRVDSSDEDSLITSLIYAAQSNIEINCGIRLFTQSVTMSCDTWADLQRLPVAPVSAITAISYYDGAGTSQTLSTSNFSLFGASTLRAGIRANVSQVFPQVAAYQDAITVAGTVGFADDATGLPSGLYRALLLTLGDYYQFREDTVAERSVTPQSLPVGVEAMLVNYRVF
jgi:uncharacterized phiE125 gp8 family phage protein